MTRLGQPHNGYFSERWWPWKLSPSPAQDHSLNALLLLPLWFSIAAAAVLPIATDEFSSSSLSFPGWRSEKKSPCEVVCLTLVFSSTVFLALLLKWLGIQKRFQLSTPPWGAQHLPWSPTFYLAWKVTLQRKARAERAVETLRSTVLLRRDYGMCITWPEVVES